MITRDHNWPENKIHLFGPWMAKDPTPKPTQYRVCVHPNCNASETRDTPKA